LAEVVILIVGYRNAEDIGDCLRALARSNLRPTFDVYIAENGGAAGMDGLTAMLDAGDPAWTKADGAAPLVAPDHGSGLRSYRLAGREDRSGYVHVAESSENFGYAGGVNVWLRPLLADHSWNAAWILNPDTRARPDSLAQLAAYSSRRNKGMVGSLIVRDDDPDVVMMRGLAWRKWTGRCIAVGRRQSASVKPDVAAIEAILTSPSGASLYVTRALIDRIGLMYDPYFLYCEDLEWGDRAKRLGEVGYAHDSVVAHKYGTTIGSSQRRAERSALSVYMTARNTVLFARRNYPAMMAPAIAMQLIQGARLLAAGAPRNFGFALRGILDGCLGKTGRPDPMPISPTAAADPNAGRAAATSTRS
jgi:GT2 family glycosyltransferase